jgi:hypothetical protein
VHQGDASSYARCAILTAPEQENSCNLLEEKTIKTKGRKNNNNNNNSLSIDVQKSARGQLQSQQEYKPTKITQKERKAICA